MFLFYFYYFFDVLTCALLGDLETLCETYQCVSVGIVFDENVCALLCSVLWLKSGNSAQSQTCNSHWLSEWAC